MHRLTEALAIFGFFDTGHRGADHFDAVSVEHAHSGDFNGGIQSGLAAQGRQQGVRPFARDDLGDRIGRDRLDVGPVGRFRIGHDRGRVAVD